MTAGPDRRWRTAWGGKLSIFQRCHLVRPFGSGVACYRSILVIETLFQRYNRSANYDPWEQVLPEMKSPNLKVLMLDPTVIRVRQTRGRQQNGQQSSCSQCAVPITR